MIPFNVPAPDDLAPDHPLGAAAEEDAVRRFTAALPVLFRHLRMWRTKARSPFLAGGTPSSKRLNASAWALKPLLHALNENGGLATRKSKSRSSLAL